MGADEDAPVAEDGVTGEAGAIRDQGEVVGGVSGSGHRLERAEPHALLERDVDIAAAGPQRRGAPFEQCPDGLPMVGMVVRERDAAETGVDRSHQALEVGLHQRARVDDPGRPAPHHPRVRPRQGQRPGIGREQTQDVIAAQQLESRLGLG